MSDRPTPETDAERHDPTEIIIKCLRILARDIHSDDGVANLALLEAADCLERVTRERDEAREALKDWENATAHVEADHPDERHCGCVPVLRKLLTDARRELAGWDNKWRCAVEMAARAEVERDEARNKMADALQEVDLRILCVDRMNQECYELREELRTAVQERHDFHWELLDAIRERDELRKELEEYRSIAENIGAVKAVSEKEKAIRERDEARKICRELNDLVAYGLGQSGEPWSIDAMRQAADAIQKAKSLEE